MKSMDAEEIEGMLVENSDEPYAAEITEVLINWRKHGKSPETTAELKEAIEEALTFLPEKEKKEAVKKSCQRTFQALRIEVNDEMRALKEMLQQTLQVLKPGGRLVVITYHSLEDRLVKNFLKTGNFEGKASKTFSEMYRRHFAW